MGSWPTSSSFSAAAWARRCATASISARADARRGFPYATFFINVSGSFVMGLIAAWFAFKGDASQHWRLFLTTGVLGGYTTFSTFSLDAALLYERGAAHARRGLRDRLGRARYSSACSQASPSSAA